MAIVRPQVKSPFFIEDDNISNDLIVKFALIPDTDEAEQTLFGKGLNTASALAASAAPLEEGNGNYQLVDVRLKGEENYIKFFTCSEVMINPGQLLFASLPAMPGKVVLQLPIELYGRFNVVISRDITPCIVNLRRP